MRSTVESSAAREEFRRELHQMIDEEGPDYAELCGIPLSDVFDALIETYTPQGNEGALAELWGCTPMVAFERIRVDLPRLLNRLPRLLSALTRAAGVPPEVLMKGATTMNETQRNDLVRSALTKIDEIRDSIPASEILVEFTGSVESLVLLHLVKRTYHNRIRMGLLFLARLDSAWAPVGDYLEETTQMFGLTPIEPHNEQAFQTRVWTADSKFLEAVRERVGPGKDGEGYRVVLRATKRDRVLDSGETFNADGMETRIVLGDWPAEGFLAYADWHQLVLLDAAKTALRYDQRVVAARTLDGIEPFVAAWPWDKDVPTNAESLIEQTTEAPRLPGELVLLGLPARSQVLHERYQELIAMASMENDSVPLVLADAIRVIGRFIAAFIGETDPFPELPVDLTKESPTDVETSEPEVEEAIAEPTDSTYGYTRDSNGRWRKDGAYVAASKVPEGVKQTLGGKS